MHRYLSDAPLPRYADAPQLSRSLTVLRPSRQRPGSARRWHAGRRVDGVQREPPHVAPPPLCRARGLAEVEACERARGLLVRIVQMLSKLEKAMTRSG
jgi:hypothetical protein